MHVLNIEIGDFVNLIDELWNSTFNHDILKIYTLL
jgi:hypothetical protein